MVSLRNGMRGQCRSAEKEGSEKEERGGSRKRRTMEENRRLLLAICFSSVERTKHSHQQHI